MTEVVIQRYGIAGTNGATSRVLTVDLSSDFFTFDGAGALDPISGQSVTATANKQNITGTVNWAVQDMAGTNKTPVTTYLSAATGNSVSMTAAQFNAARGATRGVHLIATVTDTASSQTFTSQQTIVMQKDGQNFNVSPFDPGAWFDASDLSTMRQDRTGAGATIAVAVGDPVGSWLNKGTKGGWATAPSDAARPVLHKFGRFYRLVFDGVDDVLILTAPAFNMSSIHVCVGCKFLGNDTYPGILTFAPETGNDYNSDHGFSLICGVDGMFGMIGGGTGSGGPVLNMNASGIMEKNAHVLEYFKQGNNTDAILKVDNAVGAVSSSETTFGTQTGDLIIGARQGNGILEFCNVEIGEIVASSPLPSLSVNSIRTHAGIAVYGQQPQFPAIVDNTTLNAARATLISEVFSGGGIPTAVATLALESPAPLNASSVFSNLLKCEKLTIPGYAASHPRLLTPTGTVRSDIIYLVNAGHDATWMDNGIAQYVIGPLLTAGIRVCAFVLPDGPNDLTSGGPGNHNADHTPLDQWAGPVCIAINKLKADFPSAAIYMTGISGGGWTTQFCAAVDTRIVKSYQYCGSIPDYYYGNRDWEQRLNGLTADYMTLYLLAASPARRHLHVLYDYDPVGVNKVLFATQAPYEGQLSIQALLFSGFYDLKWINYNQHAYNTASAALFLSELP